MRLAQRQGLLTGPSLSPAQLMAMSIMDVTERYEDARLRSEADLRAFKRAMMPMLKAETIRESLFPEYFPEDEEGAEDREVQDIPDLDERAELDAWTAQRSGEMSAMELEGSEWR